jgi:FkbM family methyltransferase
VTLKETRAAYRSGQLSKHDYILRMHGFHKAMLEYAEFIEGSDVSSIEIEPGRVVLRTCEAGIRIGLDSVDERLIPLEIVNFGAYEPDETAMVLRLVKGASTVFDVGANIGWYSLNIAARFGDAVDVHAFEPLPPTFDQLVANIALNKADSIHAHPFGFSDETCEKTFYYYPEGSGNASTANLSERDDVERIACEVRTLDEYAAESGVVPGFMKCDVEGAELMVFRGGRETIAKAHPIVFTEMLRKWSKAFGYSPNDIIDWFADLGYACFTVSGSSLARFGRVDEETSETNFFFLHEVEHADRIAGLLGSN